MGGKMAIGYDAIGLRIKFARIRARMAQEKLAERAGWSLAHVSNIEAGNTKLSLPTIACIANALSASADTLLCGGVACPNHVRNWEAREIRRDCSHAEIRILADVLKYTREALRKGYAAAGGWKPHGRPERRRDMMGECRNQELILFSEFLEKPPPDETLAELFADPRFSNGPLCDALRAGGAESGTECGAPAGLGRAGERFPLMTNGLESPVVQAGL